jgi:hypothetical protein
LTQHAAPGKRLPPPRNFIFIDALFAAMAAVRFANGVFLRARSSKFPHRDFANWRSPDDFGDESE